ncbi:MAG: hypothetical protein ACLPN5_07745 [Roseiarcus sp.]
MPIDRSARGPFVAMAAIAGAVVANAQPMLPLIASSLGAPKASIGLIPGFTLVGFAFGLATLLPLGDAIDSKNIVLAQIRLAAFFALGSAASGWLMARWGWSGVAGLGASAGAAAALVHLAPDRSGSR